MKLLTISALTALFAAFPAAGQDAPDPGRVSAAIRIEQSLAVAPVQTMRFTPMTTRTGAPARTQSGATVVRITGDPGRSYRITLPSNVTAYPGGLLVENLTVTSGNSGDVTRQLSATVNAEGRDSLTISGVVAPASGGDREISALFPISLYYE